MGTYECPPFSSVTSPSFSPSSMTLLLSTSTLPLPLSFPFLFCSRFLYLLTFPSVTPLPLSAHSCPCSSCCNHSPTTLFQAGECSTGHGHTLLGSLPPHLLENFCHRLSFADGTRNGSGNRLSGWHFAAGLLTRPKGTVTPLLSVSGVAGIRRAGPLCLSPPHFGPFIHFRSTPLFTELPCALEGRNRGEKVGE